MPARTTAWRRRARRTLAAATGGYLLLAIAACSPYDPSLPDKPFVCASTEPRCPDGYACVADGKRMVCSAGGEPVPDAGTDATTAR